MNLQLEKASNLGDIIKHSALVETARIISDCNRDRCVNYLDTHAFQMETTLSDTDSWRCLMSGLLEKSGGYKNYFNTELPYVDSGRYLCSCGLVARYLPCSRLFMAEADDTTRNALISQLHSSGLKAEVLLSDMHDFGTSSLKTHAGPLLALVDPFFETKTEWCRTWNSAKAAIEGLHKTGNDGAVLVFHYNKTANPLWLEPPSGFIGPVATADFRPYYMALYCTESITPVLTKLLLQMGWH